MIHKAFLRITMVTIGCATLSTGAKAQVMDTVCAKIQYLYDKFNDEKTYQTPSLQKKNGKLVESKMDYVKVLTRKFAPVYYLNLKTSVLTPLLVEHGVVLILADGKTIRKPRAVVTTDVNRDGKFTRSSYITLTPADLDLLRRWPVKKYKLFTDSDTVDNEEDYRIWLNCLTNRN